MGSVDEVVARSDRQFLKISTDDTTSVMLRFASGATGYLGTLTATAPGWRIQVFGTGGWAEMHSYDRLFTCTVAADGTPGKEEMIEFGPFDMERAELEAFADACTGGPAYPLTLAEAVHGTAVLEAIIRGAEGGAPVALKDILGRGRQG